MALNKTLKFRAWAEKREVIMHGNQLGDLSNTRILFFKGEIRNRFNWIS